MSKRKDQMRLAEARDAGVHDSGFYVDLGEGPDIFRPEILRWSFEEILFKILPPDQAVSDQVRNFLQAFLPAYDDLKRCKSVNRLIGLHQLGIKPDLVRNIINNRDVPVQVTSIPSIHTRWGHCKFVAAIMIAFGIRFKFDLETIALGAMAALLHDVGHPAFGHDLDDILISLGRPDHEERGKMIVRYDPEIWESLDLLEINPEDIVKVIDEEGELGRLQKIADTLGYVVLDSQVALDVPAVPLRFIWKVISSVERVSGDQYHVNNLGPIKQLVNYRADMYRGLYSAFPSRITAHVLRNFYQVCVEKKIFRAEDFERGTDSWIKAEMPYRIRHAERTQVLPDWFRSAMNLAFGFIDELTKWQMITCPDQASAEQIRDGLSLEQLMSKVIIPPSDYRKKTYEVIDAEGTHHRLQAPESHIPETHKLWYVMFYNA